MGELEYRAEIERLKGVIDTYAEYAAAAERDISRLNGLLNDKKISVVDHPPHYNSHPSGVECISIAEHFSFCIGNAIKYLWRAGLKGDALMDLEKAKWYISREVDRVKERHGRQRPDCPQPDS